MDAPNGEPSVPQSSSGAQSVSGNGTVDMNPSKRPGNAAGSGSATGGTTNAVDEPQVLRHPLRPRDVTVARTGPVISKPSDGPLSSSSRSANPRGRAAQDGASKKKDAKAMSLNLEERRQQSEAAFQAWLVLKEKQAAAEREKAEKEKARLRALLDRRRQEAEHERTGSAPMAQMGRPQSQGMSRPRTRGGDGAAPKGVVAPAPQMPVGYYAMAIGADGLPSAQAPFAGPGRQPAGPIVMGTVIILPDGQPAFVPIAHLPAGAAPGLPLPAKMPEGTMDHGSRDPSPVQRDTSPVNPAYTSGSPTQPTSAHAPIPFPILAQSMPPVHPSAPRPQAQYLAVTPTNGRPASSISGRVSVAGSERSGRASLRNYGSRSASVPARPRTVSGSVHRVRQETASHRPQASSAEASARQALQQQKSPQPIARGHNASPPPAGARGMLADGDEGMLRGPASVISATARNSRGDVYAPRDRKRTRGSSQTLQNRPAWDDSFAAARSLDGNRLGGEVAMRPSAAGLSNAGQRSRSTGASREHAVDSSMPDSQHAPVSPGESVEPVQSEVISMHRGRGRPMSTAGGTRQGSAFGSVHDGPQRPSSSNAAERPGSTRGRSAPSLQRLPSPKAGPGSNQGGRTPSRKTGGSREDGMTSPASRDQYVKSLVEKHFPRQSRDPATASHAQGRPSVSTAGQGNELGQGHGDLSYGAGSMVASTITEEVDVDELEDGSALGSRRQSSNTFNGGSGVVVSPTPTWGAPGPAPVAAPAPAQVAQPTPVAAAAPTPAPVAQPTPVAAAAPAPAPVAQPAPVAAAAPAPAPVAQPAPVTVSAPAPAPVSAPAPVEIPVPAPVPVAAPSPLPVPLQASENASPSKSRTAVPALSGLDKGEAETDKPRQDGALGTGIPRQPSAASLAPPGTQSGRGPEPPSSSQPSDSTAALGSGRAGQSGTAANESKAAAPLASPAPKAAAAPQTAKGPEQAVPAAAAKEAEASASTANAQKPSVAADKGPYPLKPRLSATAAALPSDDEDLLEVHKSELQNFASQYAPAVLGTLDAAFEKFKASPLKLWEAMERRFPGTTAPYLRIAEEAAHKRAAARAEAAAFPPKLAQYNAAVGSAEVFTTYSAPKTVAVASDGKVAGFSDGGELPEGFFTVSLSSGCPPLPTLTQAVQALQRMSPHEAGLVDFFRKPAPLLGVVFGVLCVLLEQPTTWAGALETANDPYLLAKILHISVIKPEGYNPDAPRVTPPCFAGYSRMGPSGPLQVPPADTDMGLLRDALAKMQEDGSTNPPGWTARLTKRQVDLAYKLLQKRPDVRAEAAAMRVRVEGQELRCTVLQLLLDWEIALVCMYT